MILAILSWLSLAAIMFLPALMFCPNLLNACVIFSDDFTADRTGTDYTTVSGSFTVGSGVITTGSAGALIVETTAGTTGHGHVTITAKVDTAAGSVRVVGSYVDSSNYLFGEATINGGSSTFKLWKRVAGADTQLDTTYTFTGATGTNYALDLCWDGTYASCSIVVSGTQKTKNGSYTGSGNQTGFGASPNGGTATFDTFTFSKHHADDSTCSTCANCGSCPGGTAPTHIQLTIANCGNVNGTYVLAKDTTNCGGGVAGECYWGATYSAVCSANSAPCTTNDICIHVGASYSGGNMNAAVDIWCAAGPGSYFANVTFTGSVASVDCSAFASITFTNNSGGNKHVCFNVTDNCDGTSATAAVSNL